MRRIVSYCLNASVAIWAQDDGAHLPTPLPLHMVDSGDVTEAEVLEVQQNWINTIKYMCKVFQDGGSVFRAAADAADELYAYNHSYIIA